MALNLRDRFGTDYKMARPFLVEDYVFSPVEYPSLRDYRVEHEELNLLATPLAVDRYYFLSHGPDSLKLELTLCLSGSDAADHLLFERAGAFEREPELEMVVDLARAEKVGDVGVAWQWGRDERDGVAGFVRHNVLVFIQGRYETLLEHSRAIDADLARHKTGPDAGDRAETLFELDGKESMLSVAPAGRIDLGVPTSPESPHFFLASGGSINRDPMDPGRYYYRAGIEKGTERVTMYRIGRGLIPDYQTIRISIA